MTESALRAQSYTWSIAQRPTPPPRSGPSTFVDVWVVTWHCCERKQAVGRKRAQPGSSSKTEP